MKNKQNRKTTFAAGFQHGSLFSNCDNRMLQIQREPTDPNVQHNTSLHLIIKHVAICKLVHKDIIASNNLFL